VSRRGFSLRLRITAVATVVLAIGLSTGATALAVLFAHERVASLDRRLAAESLSLVALTGSGQLPAPLPASPDVFAQIVDPAGTVLAASIAASRVVPLLPGVAPIPRTYTAGNATIGIDRLRVSVALARDQGTEVTVLVALPLTDVDEAVGALRRTMLLLVPLVVGAAGLATWLAVGSALEPVDRLRAAADGVADVRGPQAPVLPVATTGDELERLAVTLNRMLARLHTADERQRVFVADAAHELRSPLASALTQLEVALGGPPDAAARDELLRDVLVDVERLRRLVDDLLLLAHLDAAPELRRVPVDLASYADEPHSPVPVAAEPAALQRAVGNLVANARRHAREVVRISAYTEGEWGVLAVDDDGDGIKPADRERVFDRWTRLDAARARDAGGAGLGLAIARTVAEAHSGRLQLTDSDLGGARFELWIPSA